MTVLTRKARRALLKNDWALEQFVKSFEDFSHGKRTPICDPRAKIALTRVLRMALSANEPVAIMISAKIAETFPSFDEQCAAIVKMGGSAYLAAGLDIEVRATYALRVYHFPDLDHNDARVEGQAAALKELDIHTAYAGFPK